MIVDGGTTSNASRKAPRALRHKRSKNRAGAGRRYSAVTVVAWVLFAAALILGLFGAFLAPQDPRHIDLLSAMSPPSGAHWLGTDQLGRDIFSRSLAGARTAVLGPLLMAGVTTFVSMIIAVIIGYVGGRLDGTVGAVIDIVYSLPPLLVAIVAVGVLGGGYWLGIVILTVLHLPPNIRGIRASVLEQRNLPYIESSKVLGLSRWRIMRRDIFPNIVPVVSASFFLGFTYSFVALSTLSFLGLGVAPETPDWGRMIAESTVAVFENPWTALAPIILILVTAVSANLVGEGFNDWMHRRGRG